jgi:hypothetical protein
MPKVSAAAPYQPIALSDLTPENVADHIRSATQFLDKFKKTSVKRRHALGGDGKHILKFTAVHL